MDPSDILAYAYLEDSADFTVPFFDGSEALCFRDSSGKTVEVTSFGIEEKYESSASLETLKSRPVVRRGPGTGRQIAPSSFCRRRTNRGRLLLVASRQLAAFPFLSHIPITQDPSLRKRLCTCPGQILRRPLRIPIRPAVAVLATFHSQRRSACRPAAWHHSHRFVWHSLCDTYSPSFRTSQPGPSLGVFIRAVGCVLTHHARTTPAMPTTRRTR